ncbi:hypothetical protein [Pararhizobium sp. IMCC21322]|uniref:hypothetical protein n=1 Tax=Pararhizobium sp. IMCC21322 TaxID=3067903 RepID=UPI0027409C31|nr:hypothetical protein [Pararhizobium sp. IMCC21322]
MKADLFLINGPKKANAFHASGIDDFELSPKGQIEIDMLVASPDWTLYAVEPAKGKAMFVEMPEGSDLSNSVFVYQDQYDQGLRAAILDLDTFIEASQAIAPPNHLSFLFSTGRCGSTLASRIFTKLPDVWSLSEPDYLTNIAMARLKYPRAELVALVRAATLWTCRPPKGQAPTTIVIKPRSEATLIAELCQEAFPHAQNVFLYRSLLGWADSIGKLSQRAMDPALVYAETEFWRDWWDHVMAGQPLTTLEDYFPPDHGPILASEFFTLAWDLRIEGYLKALRRGMNFTAIHYADLNKNREQETARLLRGCGLSTDYLNLALEAFAVDSHKGSVSENETPAMPMPARQRARAAALLARMGKRDYVEARLPD